MYENYFRSKNQKMIKKWHKIDKSYLDNMEDKRKILEIPYGSLVQGIQEHFIKILLKIKMKKDSYNIFV